MDFSDFDYRGDGYLQESPRKVDVRLPEKGNSNFRGARPVHLIISMTKWIRNSRLSIKNSLSTGVPTVIGQYFVVKVKQESPLGTCLKQREGSYRSLNRHLTILSVGGARLKKLQLLGLVWGTERIECASVSVSVSASVRVSVSVSVSVSV